MGRKTTKAGGEYTREEMLVLAGFRQASGRTCEHCAWYVAKGAHRGCFPEGRYRKWLSPEEFRSGCEQFEDVRKR